MDFLDNSVLPQSAHHLVLLKYLLVLAYLLLIPYLSVLLGSLFFSVIYNRKGNKSGSSNYLKYSKALIDLLTMNKSIAFALGVVPFLSILFSYAQLLHLSGAAVVAGFVAAFILFLASLVLIYTYKYSFHLSDMLGAITGDEKKLTKIDTELIDEAKSYRKTVGSIYYKSGMWGLILLLFSTYLFVGSIQFALNPGGWNDSNIFNVIFSLNSFVYYLYFLAAAFAFTFAVFIFYYFHITNISEVDQELAEFSSNQSAKLGLIFTILVPVFVALSVLITSTAALSGMATITSIVILLLLIGISSLFYIMYKEHTTGFSTLLFYMFLALFTLSIIKEQLHFDAASQKQLKILAADYVDYQNKLKEEMGVSLAAISGVDIYNGRCSACHEFGRTLVGPAYNNVLPKYEDKRDDLVKYILSPVKVDANYPPMPNQGLKPKEAEAIADYIIQIYKEQNM